MKNGLLPVVVPKDAHAELFAALEADPNAKVEVSLATQTLTLPSGRKVEFPVYPFARYCMLEGVDELGYILQQEASIAAYEATRTCPLNTLA